MCYIFSANRHQIINHYVARGHISINLNYISMPHKVCFLNQSPCPLKVINLYQFNCDISFYTLQMIRKPPIHGADCNAWLLDCPQRRYFHKNKLTISLTQVYCCMMAILSSRVMTDTCLTTITHSMIRKSTITCFRRRFVIRSSCSSNLMLIFMQAFSQHMQNPI